MKIKFSSGQISYENKEGIARIALTAKVTPLEMENPCIQGKHTCMAHSSCVVEEDDFKCVCDAGYERKMCYVILFITIYNKHKT